MKTTVILIMLLSLCACSAATPVGRRINEEIDLFMVEREKVQYVQVVYPEELRQFSGNEGNYLYPRYVTNETDSEEE